jgi:1-aminocyclopropane-1-carboxylate deaminase
VSIGGIQSNQTRQVAAVAAHLGMKCVLVQENWVNYSDAVYDRVGNIEMSAHPGRRGPPGCRRLRHRHPPELGAGPGTTFEQAGWQAVPDSGRLLRASDTAAWASSAFAEEVRAAGGRARLSKFDYIVVCSVTGSTQAGMVVGFASRRPRAASRDRHRRFGQAGRRPRAQILRIAQNTARLVELGPRDHRPEDVVLDTRYGGPEYGLPNEGTLEAIRLCARPRGHAHRPRVRGQVGMHGMIEMSAPVANSRKAPSVLYAHLGGVPALNAYSFLFRNG